MLFSLRIFKTSFTWIFFEGMYEVILNASVATWWKEFASDIAFKSRDAIKLHQKRHNVNSVIGEHVLIWHARLTRLRSSFGRLRWNRVSPETRCRFSRSEKITSNFEKISKSRTIANKFNGQRKFHRYTTRRA